MSEALHAGFYGFGGGCNRLIVFPLLRGSLALPESPYLSLWIVARHYA